MSAYRKATYKMPSMKDSQEARRSKLLAEQKKKRQQLLESTRQLDAFQDLTLDSEEDDAEGPEIAREGVAAFASLLPPSFSSGEKKSKKKPGHKQPSKWADKCMYAELLEMTVPLNTMSFDDGLPTDLETAWIAISPVPQGKRCLAITHQSSGPAGMMPNTTLKSRLVGKSLIPSFPSPLPPMTVLDCILDVNWRSNGILHILDVLKWKGQDIASNEVPFRLWWRDARLSEINPLPPQIFVPSDGPSQEERQFRYPTLLSPIPWHSNLTYTSLLSIVIPAARQPRPISNFIPSHNSDDNFMDLDSSLQEQTFETQSDGLLLYVSEAAYEHGTSPLSLWVPLAGYGEHTEGDVLPIDKFSHLVQRRLGLRGSTVEEVDVEM